MRRRLSTAVVRRSNSFDIPCVLDTHRAAAYPCRPSNRPTMCLFWRRIPRLEILSHEAHLSAQQSTTSANSRLSRAHGYTVRSRGAGTSSCERPQAPERLSPHFTCTRSPGRLLRRNVFTTNQTSTASIRMPVALPMRCLPSSCDRMRELQRVSDSQ